MSLRRKCLGLSIGLLLGAGALRGAEPEAEALRLVRALNAEDFDARQSAALELAKLGEAARSALEQGAKSPDAEVGQTCKKLLENLQQAVLKLYAFDRDGQPIADAECVVTDAFFPQGEKHGAESVVVGADGAATLMPCRPGATTLNFQWKDLPLVPEALYESVETFTLGPGLNPKLFVLTRGGTVKATVQAADGKPLGDATVVLLHSFFDAETIELFSEVNALVEQHYRNMAVTDEAGQAKLEHVTDGVYHCVIVHEDFESVCHPWIRVRENELVTVPAMRLKPKRLGRLELTMQVEDGQPRENAFFVRLQPLFDDENKARRLDNLGWGGSWSQEPESTDHEGKIVREKLRPGRYRVHLILAENGLRPGFGQLSEGRQKDAEPTEFLQTLEVLPDATTRVSLKPIGGGVLTGTVTGSDGRALARARVCVLTEADLWSYGCSSRDYVPWHADTARLTATDGEGRYRLGKMAPGKYVVTVLSPSGGLARICGVDVGEGQEVTALPVNFEAPEVPRLTQVAGRVVGADGAGVPRAQIRLESRRDKYCSKTAADGQGRFAFSAGHWNAERPITHVVVRAAGYKPVTLVAGTPGLDFGGLLVRLDKQRYGKLALRVLDERGRPLPGARISLVGALRHCNEAEGSTLGVARANQSGEARLEGLVEGKRRLQVTCPGYYLPEELQVEVVADSEVPVTVTLRKTHALCGKVVTPKDRGLTGVTVSAQPLDRWDDRPARLVDEQGLYRLEDLRPGAYVLRALGPGLESRPVQARIAEDGSASESEIALSETGAVVLQLPAVWAGRTIVLKGGDYWQRNLQGESPICSAQTVDVSGRAEFWGIMPGENYVELLPAHSLDLDEGRQLQARLRLGVVTVPFCRASALRTLKPVPLTAVEHSGQVSFRIDLGQKLEPSTRCRLSVSVVGLAPDAAFEANVNGHPEAAPMQIVLGHVPDFLRVEDSDRRTVTGLPPGDYKLYARADWQQGRQPQSAPAQAPQPVLSFTLKAGEKRDLGTLCCFVPPEPPEPATHDDSDDADDGTDQVKAFTP